MKNNLKKFYAPLFLLIFLFNINISFSKNINNITNKKEDSLYIKNILLGKNDYSNDCNFVIIDMIYTYYETYLDVETYQSFIKMFDAAKKDGVKLVIISGLRTYKDQKRIWENKWKALGRMNDKQKANKILEYSSMPSTSRHHWGTEVDLNSLHNSYFEQGKGLKEYEWLIKNAFKYGFCQVYKDNPNGAIRKSYFFEKWHWSYIPKAKVLLKSYNKLIKYEDIIDFEGVPMAKEFKVIENFVNEVSECK